ncbi:5-hydroxytryptamine receptor 3A-like [Polyodon spathula]|uniref:5-hydroxytryptamine receptor 3A-like n=1 Tax=Polyodon spathula TaxID=7913 RepID=UPI001B7EB72A|nr:5-hydroxytryptamine receptor 3A-like [Polyodon spathula]
MSGTLEERYEKKINLNLTRFTLPSNFSNYEYVRFFETFKDVIGNKFLRPVKNWTTPVQLNITLTLYEIIGVDEKTHILQTYIWLRQFWVNEFLVWDPADFGGLNKVSIPVDNIWRPDLYVYEFVEEDLSPQIPYMYVRSSGRITHDKPLRIVSSCNLNIFYFPFDIQTCTLSLGPFLHTASDIVLGLHQTSDEITAESKENIQNKGEWELLNIDAQTTTWQMQGENWSKVIFKLRLKRRPLLYLVNLVIPSAFLMVIDLISFYLPVHQIDRGAFKMTLLLGYTVFLLIMNDLLPNNAGGTPIIELDLSEESKLVSSPEAQSSQLIQNLLTSLSQDILVIRSHLDYRSLHEHKQEEWIRVAFIWDCFLFRLYLLLLVVFSVILISSWCMWYKA